MIRIVEEAVHREYLLADTREVGEGVLQGLELARPVVVDIHYDAKHLEMAHNDLQLDEISSALFCLITLQIDSNQNPHDH